MYHDAHHPAVYNPEFLQRARERNAKRKKVERKKKQKVLEAERIEFRRRNVFRESWKRMVRLASAEQRKKWREQLAELDAKIHDGSITPRLLMIDTAERFCAEHGTDMETMRGPRRKVEITRLRQQLYWLLKHEHPEKSLVAIGRFMRRDHTSVLYGIRTHQARIDAQTREAAE